MLSFIGFKTPTLAAVSNTVNFTSYNEPLQGHLSLTHDPTIMTYAVIIIINPHASSCNID